MASCFGFDNKQASVLARMVMLCAMPMPLFAGIAATPGSDLTADLRLGICLMGA